MAAKSAAGFVIFKRVSNTVQYLMLQTSHDTCHWTPPKGHVDPGETDELVTAYRETKEEAGLQKGDLKVYNDSKQVVSYPVNGKPKSVSYWLAELINSQAKVELSDEHQDYKWLNIEEACSYGNYENMQDVLRHYDNYIKKNKIVNFS